MNPFVIVFATLWAVVGYREAKRVRERYGRDPFGWPPAIWAALLFMSLVIGAVLLAIASRIARRKPATMPQPAYVQRVPTYPMCAPPGYTAQPYAPQPYAPQPYAAQPYVAQPYAPQQYAPQQYAPQYYAPPASASTGSPAGVELNAFAPPTD